MLKYILLTALSAGVFIQTWTIDANSQSAWCPPGSTIVPIPGGNMCRCPDGSLANINGCQERQPQQPQQPERYKPPPYQPSTIQQQQVAGVGEAIEALSNGVKSLFMTEDQFNSVTW